MIFAAGDFAGAERGQSSRSGHERIRQDGECDIQNPKIRGSDGSGKVGNRQKSEKPAHSIAGDQQQNI